jgi:hypothetical protein
MTRPTIRPTAGGHNDEGRRVVNPNGLRELPLLGSNQDSPDPESYLEVGDAAAYPSDSATARQGMSGDRTPDPRSDPRQEQPKDLRTLSPSEIAARGPGLGGVHDVSTHRPPIDTSGPTPEEGPAVSRNGGSV